MSDIKNFRYSVSGAGEGRPWTVFLHGLLGSSKNWLRITPSFEKEFQVLCLDQRGHGKSFKPETGYSPEDFADDLLFIMNSLKIEKAHLIGHSMGGRNAACFAARYPKIVEKLVIEDIGPEGTSAAGSDLVKKLKTAPVPFPDKRRAKEYLFEQFADPKLAMFLYTSIKETPSGATWSFKIENVIEIIEKGRGKPRWHDFEKIECPTLLIRGEKSTELSRREFEEVLKRNPRIRGAEIKGAGHWVHFEHFEKPKEFTETVREFLNA